MYKFAENLGSITGMTYDGSVYYALVRNAKKGAGIQTSIEYYKAAGDGSVKQLDKDATPSFTNIYSVEPTMGLLPLTPTRQSPARPSRDAWPRSPLLAPKPPRP